MVISAQTQARLLGHGYIGTEHLLLGMAGSDDEIARRVFASLGVDETSLAEHVRRLSPSDALTDPSSTPMFTTRAKSAIELALRESLQLGHDSIGVVHLMLGLLRDAESTATKLLITQYQVDVSALRRLLLDLAVTTPLSPPEPTLAPALAGRESTSPPASSMLDLYGFNLTAAAAAGLLDPVSGRAGETERVIQVLTRRTKNNPILIGEPGVGKTAIIEGLAHMISTSQVPAALKEKQIYTIDLAQMVAGARYRGDFEERFKKLLREVASREDVVLFLDEIHTIIGAGSAEGSLDAASMLKPLLARGSLQTIGATTLDEFRRHFEKDPALARRFQSILVAPPSVDDTYEILKGLRPSYETYHGVVYTDSALRAAAELSDRYISDRFLPDKAIDLIDEAGSRMRLRDVAPNERVKNISAQLSQAYSKITIAHASGDLSQEAISLERVSQLRRAAIELESTSSFLADLVTGETVAEVLSAWTKIPLTRIATSESTALADLEEQFQTRLAGQKTAIGILARAIRRSRARLRPGTRPAGSFIFVGPSGVGKTMLAKALAEIVLGDPGAIIMLDMSEYMEKHSVSRLVGSPPGYIGYDDPGQLTEPVRHRPFSVILFDEIEKAHPDVFNLLLQVLEEGHLTDAAGRLVDFSNTFIVLTSNLGTREAARNPLGFTSSPESLRTHRISKVTEALKEHFRPEFLNRLDDIVIFDELTRDDLMRVVDLLLDPLITQLSTMGVRFVVDPAVKELLVDIAHEPSQGARPLRRAVQDLIDDPLSEMFVSGAIPPGSSVQANVSGPDSSGVRSIKFSTPLRAITSLARPLLSAPSSSNL